MQVTKQEASAAGKWQGKVSFPDWKGYTDDTLAMNSMYSFFGCHGQGTIYVQAKEAVTGFRMYVNGRRLATDSLLGGETVPVDISELTVNGRNTLQISNIVPWGISQAVTVSVPYPRILPGRPEEEGISPEALQMISDLISSDIANGFTSAQLAVIRNGRLVYENAWGKRSSRLPDGSADPESPEVTTDTLYDLASVTKMFSVNYAMQKLVTDGRLELDARITDFFGERFAADTILVPEEEGKFSLETVRAWKKALTVRDLLRHQGGFPADPKYAVPYIRAGDLPEGEGYQENPFYAGNGTGEAAREKLKEAICRTPLDYEPGTKTVYSDVDYMILGLVIEQITGADLNTWLKKNFWDPMGLTHITYNPLQAGFSAEDCAATELNGNTRDHSLDYPGWRRYTLQGEVHDEKAWYNMQGISGHAGLFANASDLACLASVMLCGGYGEHRFFSRSVMDAFTAPKQETAGNWGLGWWRQGDGERAWYFGTQAGSGTIGHQGWTGTLVMIDPDRRLVVAFLTNRINSRVTDPKKDPNRFDGNWYTAGTLGFLPQILSIGMDSGEEISAQLLDLSADMAVESLKLVPEGIDLSGVHPAVCSAERELDLSGIHPAVCSAEREFDLSGIHPAVRNVLGKLELFEKLAGRSGDEAQVRSLREEIGAAVRKARAEHKES